MLVTTQIELNDSEIEALERGPLAYAKKQYGRMMELEGFRRDMLNQFGELGFQVDVKTYETNVEGCYAFDLEIAGRVPGAKQFDPDRQVHEVVNNYLNLPGVQEGWIDSNKTMKEAADLQKESGGHGHKH